MNEPECGHELDCAIHQRIFGYAKTDTANLWRPPDYETRRSYQYGVPGYSENAGSAWVVVDRLNELGWLVVVKQMPEGVPFVIDPEGAKVQQRAVVSLQWVQWMKDPNVEAVKIGPTVVADTVEEAICRAALRAAGGA